MDLVINLSLLPFILLQSEQIKACDMPHLKCKWQKIKVGEKAHRMVSRGASTALVMAPAKAPLRNSFTSLLRMKSCIRSTTLPWSLNQNHMCLFQLKVVKNIKIHTFQSKWKAWKPNDVVFYWLNADYKKKRDTPMINSTNLSASGIGIVSCWH